MDRKLEMLADGELWERRFPEFIEKEIDAGVIASLADPEFRLKLLQMIEAGCYQFDPPRIQRIPKKNGKFREIYILGDLDRCVMALIADVYYQLYSSKIHPNCVSYRSGVGVPNILHSVSEKLGIGGYKVDISKYFDSVSREKVNSLLAAMNMGSPLDELLYKFYNTDLVKIDGEFIERYRSLGQGIALSPLLANLCLKEADRRLTEVCDVYLRYSDDILMLGSRSDEAMGILREELSKCGLALNPKKVERIDASSEFVFLGGKVRKSFVGMPNTAFRDYKLKIRKVIEKNGRKGNRAAQKRALGAVQRFLLEKFDGHGRVEYFFQLCSTDEESEVLENYVKDQLKAVYAGKQNHTVYSRMTSNEKLKEFGWCSLVALRHLFHWDKDAYNAKVKSILNCPISKGGEEAVPADEVSLEGITSVDFNNGAVKVFGHWITVQKRLRIDLMERAEKLWEDARLWEGFTPFVTMHDGRGGSSLAESKERELATKQLILLIVSSEYAMSDVWEKSRRFPELVIFRDWVTENPV